MFAAMVIALYSSDKKSGRIDICFRILKDDTSGVLLTGWGKYYERETES